MITAVGSLGVLSAEPYPAHTVPEKSQVTAREVGEPTASNEQVCAARFDRLDLVAELWQLRREEGRR